MSTSSSIFVIFCKNFEKLFDMKRRRAILKTDSCIAQWYLYQGSTMERCKAVVSLMSMRSSAFWFMKPVPIELVPDYLEVIDKPMDYSTVRKRLDSGEYKTMNTFASDMRLIFHNAILYNWSSQHVCNIAAKTELKAFEVFLHVAATGSVAAAPVAAVPAPNHSAPFSAAGDPLPLSVQSLKPWDGLIVGLVSLSDLIRTVRGLVSGETCDRLNELRRRIETQEIQLSRQEFFGMLREIAGDETDLLRGAIRGLASDAWASCDESRRLNVTRPQNLSAAASLLLMSFGY
jgi:hypothetical protein